MNAEIKKRWVEALKSGVYVKGKGRLLSRGNEYCCLGVLCELASKDGIGTWEVNPNLQDEAPRFRTSRGEMSESTLPTQVVEWAGLDTTQESWSPLAPVKGSNPLISARKMQQEMGGFETAGSLAELNDYSSMTLAEIGDVIEAEL